MDVNSIKVGDVLNLGTTDYPNYRLVLDVTPETFWLGNYAHGRGDREQIAGNHRGV